MQKTTKDVQHGLDYPAELENVLRKALKFAIATNSAVSQDQVSALLAT